MQDKNTKLRVELDKAVSLKKIDKLSSMRLGMIENDEVVYMYEQNKLYNKVCSFALFESKKKLRRGMSIF